MAGRLDGKVAIITGGASGMGEATSRLFVAEGARVVIGDVQDEKAAAVASALGDACVAVHADVTSAEDLHALVRAAAERFGKLDVMYNNAGGGRRDGAAQGGKILEMSEEAWRDTVDLNLTSVWLGMRAALPYLIENGGGSIVSTASVSAFMGMVGQSAYGAAKGGVVQLTRVAAIEYAEHNVRVNCICPGGTLTPLLYDFPGRPDPRSRDEVEAGLQQLQPIQRAGLPEDIAKAALWLASDDSSFVTGESIIVDGGWMASARTPADQMQAQARANADSEPPR